MNKFLYKFSSLNSRFESSMNKYLVKLAKKTQGYREDRPHQVQALEKLDRTGGIVLNHGLGSGKTSIMLRAISKAQNVDKEKDSLIVAPASLVSNIDDEIKKSGIKIDRKRLQVYSYERATNKVDELSKQKFSVVALDEAHKIRNIDAKRTQALMDIAKKSDKRILATGTSVYNSPHDVSSLINVAAGYDALPTDKKKFENKFIRETDKPRSLAQRILGHKAEKEDTLVGRRELGEIFKDHLHYYDPKEDEAAKGKFPTKTEEIIPVEMSDDQEKYYKFLEHKLPFMLRYKIKYGLPLEKQERQSLNAFSVGIRQVSNTHRHFTQKPDSVDYSPKLQEAFKQLKTRADKDKNFKALVHSSFLDAGVDEYSKLLTEKGIKHGVYTGRLSASEKDELKDKFSKGKIPVMLISDSGAEGLNLKGVKLVQHLDGHFNKSRGRQVTGRAIRYESHSHLPEDERNVHVQHFHSTFKQGVLGTKAMSIDQYLDKMGDEKDRVFNQLTDIMKEHS